MAEEWEREKQAPTERNADPNTRAVSDPRNYLYIELKSGAQSNPACDARLAIQAKLRGNDRWYSSDHETDSLQIQSQGWRRGTIELPPGTTGNQIESLRFVAYPGKNVPACALVVTNVRKAFLLNQDYVPTSSLVTWNGNQVLDADNATSASANSVLPVIKRSGNSCGKDLPMRLKYSPLFLNLDETIMPMRFGERHSARSRT